MRILYYIYSLPVGGAETIVKDYLCALQDRGHEVCLVEDFYTDSFLTQILKARNIPIYTLWNGNAHTSLGGKCKRAARMLGLNRRFDRIAADWKPDVIHLHGFPDHADKLRFPKNRMFFTFHSELHRNLSILGNDNQERLQRMCDDGLTLCCLTEGCAAECRSLFHTDRVLCTPNGVDFDKVRAHPYSRERLEALFGIPRDRFLVGTLGRLDPIKDHERMLRIFREVKNRRPGASLLIVGGDCARRMDGLRQECARLGLTDSVVFTGQRQDADRILAAMDCFLLTSRSESFSLVSIEAQALGIKCVLSDAVPEEVACRGCTRLPLSEPDSAWADAVLAPAPECVGDLDVFCLDTVIDRLTARYRAVL